MEDGGRMDRPPSTVLHPLFLNLRIARQLQVRKPHRSPVAVHHEAVVDAEFVRRVEPFAPEFRHVVVLVDAVAADAEASDRTIAAIERHAAGKPHDAALIQKRPVPAARGARPFGARVLRVVDVEIEPRPRPRVIR